MERTRLNVQCLLLQLQNSHPLIHQMSNENMIPVKKKPEMKMVLQVSYSTLVLAVNKIIYNCQPLGDNTVNTPVEDTLT